jgi:hypothetical protein
MLKSYFTIAIRHLLKHKAYSLINGFSLAIGIAFCLLILVFVKDELSFDGFHANAQHIYRIHKTDVSEPAYSEGESGFFSALKTRQDCKYSFNSLFYSCSFFLVPDASMAGRFCLPHFY